jgi:hypothetical protein
LQQRRNIVEISLIGVKTVLKQRYRPSGEPIPGKPKSPEVPEGGELGDVVFLHTAAG